MSTLLKVEGLVTRLHSGARIVDDISFGINAGETFALLGESGCGKSMTALSLMRLLPDGVGMQGGAMQLGEVALHGLSEREMCEVRGGSMAMIFQEPGLSLNPVMTVGEQIAEVLALHGVNPYLANPSSPSQGEGGSPLSPAGMTSDLPAGGLIEPSIIRDSLRIAVGRVIPAMAGATRPTRSGSHVPDYGNVNSRMAGGSSRGPGNGSGWIKQRCAELLQQVGIPDPVRRLDEYPFQLSGGMKQRVMIAMALAGQPELLIADEPTTALDVTIQAQVLQLLRDTQAKEGMAMLLITHDLGVVAEMAHQVAVMYAGQIVEQASRAKLFAAPAHPYTQKLFAALPDARHSGQPLAAIPGNVPALGQAPLGCRFAPRCDQAWALCHEQAPAWTVLEGGQGVRCHLYREGGREKGEGDSGKGEEGREKGKPTLSASYPSPFPLPPSLLQVENLQVHFPIRKGILQRTVGAVKAVDGVSLDIAAGRTLALVGESGCGKTTVGKALLQLIKPTAGSVQFAGKQLVGLGGPQLRAQRGSMQMVFQDPYASLNPKMRVAEILQEGMDALGIGASSAERQQRIDRLLDQVGLAQAAKWRYPHEFSGGQRQRIAIARALAVNPALLICDEPTSALDVSVQAQILNLLRSLQQELGLSYLFITHNLSVVEYVAHEVCVMYLGRIVERGTVQEVMRNAQHPYTRALLSAVPRIDGSGAEVIRLAGEMPSPANPPQGCHFHPRCAQAMAVCREHYPEVTQLTETHRVHCHLLSRK